MLVPVASERCPVPIIGLGTYRMTETECRVSVPAAIRMGYRHIDTAAVYRNEGAIGEVVADLVAKGEIAREELFITSKIAPADQGEDKAYAAVLTSLSKLRLEYLDLMLIHWPGASKLAPSSPENAALRAGTWQALERHVREGRVRHIGVSNYTVAHLDQLVAHATIPPAVLQIELHPWYAPADVLAWCNAHGVVVEAYSSLGEGYFVDRERVPEFPEVDAPAARLGTSRAAVLLAWARTRGWVTLPKARSEARLREDLASAAVELLPAEVAALDALTAKGHKFCWDPVSVL
ncbi:hypothetical protein H9P43_001387 [Blastocladiella emersonii ATCC 22665]|nr:hypothetical protein H9P43_001387 [Blastocladiella emersonii ATCC 22665]